MAIEIVAEFGQSHRGDVATAIRQAEVAKAAGCAYVKWQMFDPERIAGPTARRYWDPALGGAETQLETFHTNGNLAPDGWRHLKTACDEIGIGFLVTPFDLEAVDLLEELDVAAYKIASGDITYRQLLLKVAATGKPVFLSTGAAHLYEVEQALVWLGHIGVTLLACALSYPCEPKDANLARIQTLLCMAERVGYSDHTLGSWTALAAVAAGADVLEKHATLNPVGDVPDDRMALGPDVLAAYVDLARYGEELRGSDEIAPVIAEWPAREGARRSLHAAHDIDPGHIFQPGDFTYLRPAGPYEPADEDYLFGRRAVKAIPAGKQIAQSDLARI